MTETDQGVAQRQRNYRIVFLLAALYNFAFAFWTAAWPLSFFHVFGLAPVNHPAIWQCLGMVIGVYGAGYAWAAYRPESGKPIIALGLAGKILGPIGWVAIVASGEWPVRTITLIIFNDLVWWLPFSLFLLEGTRLGDRIRCLAPQACALLNAAAGVAMLALLRPGMEVVPDAAARAAYIAGHPVAWRTGWALWIGAAICLAGFYAWWGSRLGRPRPATGAFLIVLAGVACDLLAESLYIGWLPTDLESVAPIGTLLTGGAANGLYTIAGILLTLSTPSLSPWMKRWAWVVWACGAGVTLFTVTGFIPGLVAGTAGLMILLPPWVWMMGGRLR